MIFVLSVLGAVLVIEGIPYFAFPKRVKEWALMLEDVPERTLRIIGLATMAFGVAVLFAIRFFSR